MKTPNEPQIQLYRIAEAQGGYFTAKQAASLGYASNKRVYMSKLATGFESIAESIDWLSTRSPIARI